MAFAVWGGDPVYPTINYIQDPNEIIDYRGPDFHEPTPDMLDFLKEVALLCLLFFKLLFTLSTNIVWFSWVEDCECWTRLDIIPRFKTPNIKLKGKSIVAWDWGAGSRVHYALRLISGMMNCQFKNMNLTTFIPWMWTFCLFQM